MAGEAEDKFKILLVDDHPFIRQGLSHVISQERDFEVCGEAESVAEALTLIAERRPDIVVVDLSLKDSSGLDLLRKMKRLHPSVPALVLSTHDEREYAERALGLGALGYVMKNKPMADMMLGIHKVLGGETSISDELAGRMRAAPADNSALTDKASALLSDRELEVFQCLGKGLSTREIAKSLDISINTVQVYCGRIKGKLGLHNALELMRRAVQWVDQQ